MNLILIDSASEHECRVAVCKKSGTEMVLEALYQQNTRIQNIKGNIYLAKVVRVENALQAVFVDYGGQYNAFLPLSNVSNEYKTRSAHNKHLKKDQLLIIQIVKEQKDEKCPLATTYITLTGRFISVISHSSQERIRFMRKIGSDKERLKNIGNELLNSVKKNDRGLSIVFKNESEGRTKIELKRDFQYLVKLLDSTLQHSENKKSPVFLHAEGSFVECVIRDTYNNDIKSIIVEGKEKYKQGLAFMKMFLPTHVDKIEQYDRSTPIFKYYDIEEKVTALYSNKVLLPSGGSIVISYTEAMITIDVNSGKNISESNVENTSLKTNLEAIKEIIIQIKLRGLSGTIAIDFIDLESTKNRDLLFKEALQLGKDYNLSLRILPLNELSIMHITRQKTHNSFCEINLTKCDNCSGTGYIRAEHATISAICRAVKQEISKNAELTNITVVVGAKLATQILNYTAVYDDIIRKTSDHDITFRFMIDLSVPETMFSLTASSEVRQLANAVVPFSKLEEQSYFDEENGSTAVRAESTENVVSRNKKRFSKFGKKKAKISAKDSIKEEATSGLRTVMRRISSLIKSKSSN
ncbi:ribonuclease Rne/Rng family [Candidatus Fokinia solitaria]|uniref:Ribonuclease Rne/Rng family n=1 Tax=Candidatus Fokinia solitaria TaxID=1802984 RepID=A0A2U8BRJ3_9RICK|nr:Rne/Rng family ribonuclease [Candidatus Fokinia solitaria]AWD32976.1 ribonuclease Rne/Rng family [Candidatus Fokinia solitaria]